MPTTETIVAPATPPGEGGIGIVRISGPQAESLLAAVFSAATVPATMLSHHLYHGYLVNRAGERIDEVLAVIMRAPRSYTGEDVVELHCHGGTQILRSVLDLLLDAGARMAAPGEFTQRAFLNGRLDLAQAEAVIDVIRARSGRACRIAVAQLGGQLSRQIHLFSSQIRDALAHLEAHIDFADDDVGTLDLDGLSVSMWSLSQSISRLVASFDDNRALREGLSVLILGRPNVGKSSLMNALLGEARSIVTEIAGTTRDTLEEQFVLAGFPLRLIDAAGIRNPGDPVELEGVLRARGKAAAADLILLVVDGAMPLAGEDLLALELCRPENTVLVVNKSDCAQRIDLTCLDSITRQVAVSARYGLGLDELRSAIVDLLGSEASLAGNEGVVVTERRHRDALLNAAGALRSFQGVTEAAIPLECLAMDLREALSALGLITGETTPDQILDQIFSRFCIGK